MGAPALNPDITSDDGHLQNNCSYFAHVESHLYQYVALFRLIKELATSEDARREFWDQLMDSAAGHFIAADSLNSWAKQARNSAGEFADRAKSGWSVEDWINQAGHDWFGYSVPWAKDGSAQAYNNRRAHEESDRAKKLQDAADIHYDIAKGKLKDFFVSLWNEIKKRWTECGALYAVATTATDAAFFVGELALGAGLSAGALALLKSIKFTTHLAGAGRAVAGALAEGVTVTKDTVVSVTAVAGIPGSAMRKITRSYKANELKAEVDELASHSGVLKEDPQRPLKEEVSAAAAKKKKLTRGKNDTEISYDPKTGRPTNAKGTLRQDFGSTPRGDNATAVGKLGEAGDQGGHLVAHRFMGDTPDEGIAPQAGNLNQGAWKTMENEWADWVNKGYEVDYNIDVYPPGAVRPNTFEVQYRVRDPTTGKIVYKNSPDFKNEAGQTFSRVPFRSME